MTIKKLKELNAKLTEKLYPFGISTESEVENLKLPTNINVLLRNDKRNPNNDDKPTKEGWEKSKNNPKNW